LLDVAHNSQSARALAAAVGRLSAVDECSTTVVVGMFADKQAAEFAAELNGKVSRWITCDTAGVRASSAVELAARLAAVVAVPVTAAGSVADAVAEAKQLTPLGDRIVVCGSFTVVGPVLEQLGLY